MRVALATCRPLPEPDDDEALLVAALRAAGLEVSVLAWDEPDAPFAAHDLVVVRSTWDYFRKLDAFLVWVDATAAATRLANPADVIRGNAQKTYLRELAARGIDVVPTELVPRGATTALSEILVARGWDEVVVKPVVSAGSFRTARFGSAMRAQGDAFLADLTAERDAMVQRFLPTVETSGERSLIWIDGELTHSIRKTTRFAGAAEAVSGEVPIDAEQRAFAERVLAASGVRDRLLYARIDVVRDPEGVLRLMELELIEPSLYLAQSRRALDRLVSAIARRVDVT